MLTIGLFKINSVWNMCHYSCCANEMLRIVLEILQVLMNLVVINKDVNTPCSFILGGNFFLQIINKCCSSFNWYPVKLTIFSFFFKKNYFMLWIYYSSKCTGPYQFWCKWLHRGADLKITLGHIKLIFRFSSWFAKNMGWVGGFYLFS